MTTAEQAADADTEAQENWPENGELIATPVRDPNTGRFLKGHAPLAGAGRPPKSPQERNQEILMDVMNPVRMEALAMSTLKRALEGDKDARQTLFKYILPEPVQSMQMLTLQAQLGQAGEEFEAIEPWEHEDAPSAMAGAISTLEGLGLIKTTDLFRQQDHAEPEETLVRNDFHPSNGHSAKENAAE